MDDGAALGDEAVAGRRDPPRAVADHQAAVAAVADQDVGAEPEEELGHTGSAGGGDGVRQVVGARGGIEEVGRAADAEGGVGGERLALAQADGRGG